MYTCQGYNYEGVGELERGLEKCVDDVLFFTKLFSIITDKNRRVR